MPFPNNIVQAIEAGCLHLAETGIGLGQTDAQLVPFLLARFPFLSQPDVLVIIEIARRGREFPASIEGLPGDAALPIADLPINPVVKSGELQITMRADIFNQLTQRNDSIVGVVIVPDTATLDDFYDIVDQWVNSVLDRYLLATQSIVYEISPITAYKGGS